MQCLNYNLNLILCYIINQLTFQGVEGTVTESQNVTSEGASGQTTDKYLLDFVKVNIFTVHELYRSISQNW